MVDYIALLKADLVEQFKGKANIEAFVEAVGGELQQIFDFYQQLRNERDVYSAVGKQLDGVGNIVDLSRMEAGKLAGDPIPFDIIDDDTYRQYLIYKILKNNSDCTYPDIIKAFRMFWDRPLYYSEDPEQPATMIFDTGEMPGDVDTTPLFRTPLIRAAGVTLKLYAKTSTPMEPSTLNILSGLGFAVTVTNLPVVERNYDFKSKVYAASNIGTVVQDDLPVVERAYKFEFSLGIGANAQSVTHDMLPELERNIQYDAAVNGGSVVGSVMETPINGITLQKNA